MQQTPYVFWSCSIAKKPLSKNPIVVLIERKKRGVKGLLMGNSYLIK